MLHSLRQVSQTALAYEKSACGKRKMGITAEVGEVLACHTLGLGLSLDSRSKGFDAIDEDGMTVQIKTRRNESEGLPRTVSRIGRFSKHPFDYALLVILDHEYELHEIWRAEYSAIWPAIEKQKKRNPNLATFKRLGKRVWPV